MLGTPAWCPVKTFHAVLSRWDMILPSPLITWSVSIGSSHHPQPQSRVTPRSLPHGSEHAAKSPNYLFWSNVNGTKCSSTPIAPTPESICLATLDLPDVPHGRMPPRDALASSSTSLPAHGASLSPQRRFLHHQALPETITTGKKSSLLTLHRSHPS
jgi:hypothetical protein